MNKLPILIAAAIAACATTADATIFTVTETGTIIGGGNSYGTGAEFGAASADALVGMAFSVTYRFDTDMGTVVNNAFGSQFYGVGSAAITINGVTNTIVGLPYLSTSSRANLDPAWGAPFASQLYNVVEPEEMGDFVEDYLALASPLAATGLTAPLFYRTTAADSYYDMYAQIGGTHVRGTIDTLSANGGAVPEPASWAMVLIGFGAIGGMMRTRRTTAARFA